MKVLGIIPARGGSKGLKKKNIRLLNDKPLISYTIEAAKKSKLLTNYLVTSDDDDILNVTRKYNCQYHRRSTANAQDNSTIEDVVIEVLDFLCPEIFDLIVLLQPTAPIRNGQDIDNVISMFVNDMSLKNVVSVVKLEDIHPARMYTVDANSGLNAIEQENEKARRQDLTSVYLRNGCIYAIRVDEFLRAKSLMLKEKKAYIMSQETWANIDSERDLIVAEAIIKHLKK